MSKSHWLDVEGKQFQVFQQKEVGLMVKFRPSPARISYCKLDGRQLEAQNKNLRSQALKSHKEIEIFACLTRSTKS
jgi:hypothetical protein